MSNAVDRGDTYNISIVAKAMMSGKNILIAGATSSGKTVFLDRVLAMRAADDSALILERLPELTMGRCDFLQLHDDDGPSLSTLTSVPPIDRVVLGSIRSANGASTALHFIGEGYPCLATIHAATAEDAWDSFASLAGITKDEAKSAFTGVVVMKRDERGSRYPDEIVGI